MDPENLPNNLGDISWSWSSFDIWANALIIAFLYSFFDWPSKEMIRKGELNSRYGREMKENWKYIYIYIYIFIPHLWLKPVQDFIGISCSQTAWVWFNKKFV